MSGYEDLRDLVTVKPMALALPERSRRRAQFKASLPNTISLLARELAQLGAKRAVLEVDIAPEHFRLDGTPRASAIARSPGIILSFKATHLDRNPDLRYEVDTFDEWPDNLRGLALGLESLRAVDRYGVTKSGEQYAGWKQLASRTIGEGNPEHGRQLISNAGGDVRRALAQAHPDLGGDPDDFRDVIAARDAQEREARAA